MISSQNGNRHSAVAAARGFALRLLADEFGRALFEKSRDAFAKIFGSSGQALHAAFEIELLLV
jgi:hypothetical protein